MNVKRFLILLLLLIEAITVNETTSFSHPLINRTSFSVKSRQELFSEHIRTLYNRCELSGELDFYVFQLSMVGYYNILQRGLIEKDSIITIIDYEKPSYEKRMYVININKREVIFNSLVAHGMNTGNVYAESFSNRSGSKMSSLGFFITGRTYDGKHKYSLKLHGIDTTYNTNALCRGVVFHGAKYVSESYAEKHGRVGRSFGCPALPLDKNKTIIDVIKDGSCVFVYYPDERYLSKTPYLDLDAAVNYCYGDRDFYTYAKIPSLTPHISSPVKIESRDN